MAADLQFEAEYAKSGRSKCKLCKNNISKDSLRIARCVQSFKFDGKVQNWYHPDCFFEANTVGTTDNIEGFEALRWDDQQKIKKYLQRSEGSEDAKKFAPTRHNFEVEYAKSGRSTCRACLSQIDKGAIRIAKIEVADPQEKKGYAGPIPEWHHVECFLENREALDATEVKPEGLSGFNNLEDSDKDELKQKFDGKSMKKEKKHGREEEGSAPSRKKAKKEPSEESPEEKLLKEQNDLLWKTHDELKKSLETNDLKVMLQRNNQSIPVGESKVLDYCADGMVFGALKPCPECKGQLEASGHCYECTGHVSAWTSCTYKTLTPDRGEWVVPEELKGVPFLKNYKYKPRQRKFAPKSMSPEPKPDTSKPHSGSEHLHSQPASTAPTPKPPEKTPSGSGPLKGFAVVIIGRLKKIKAEMAKEIEDLGGTVVTSISDKTTICISSKKELEKMSKMMAQVKSRDIPVVSEDYLHNAPKSDPLQEISKHTISPWGSVREPVPTAFDDSDSKKTIPKDSMEVKQALSGAADIDPESGLAESHHVYHEDGVVYNAVLEQVDIAKGTNSYYKIQLLEENDNKNYCVFRAWGRVGTSLGNSKMDDFGTSKDTAKHEFESLYFEKTGNSWNKAGNVTKQPGKYYPMEIDYSQPPQDAAGPSDEPGKHSNLAPQLQHLIKMIFDIEAMKGTMEVLKMPLGKVSKHEIQSAYSVLSELQQEIAGERNPSKLLDASNRFYTLVPHDFGLQKPTVLDSDELISTKTKMLDDLLEIEVAYNLLKEGSSEGEKDVLNVHYEQLKTNMEVLKKSTNEFKILEKYMTNSQISNHHYKLEIIDVFKLARHEEEESFRPFQKFQKRYLLWYGSRTTSFAGILSHGLRTPLLEAPSSAYILGKGIYFADMVSKSSDCCAASRSNPIGLLLLCEVALGNMYEKTESEFITKLPPGKHSTKGVGRTCPDPSENKVLDGGLVVPIGKGVPAPVSHTSFPYNEYVVYDSGQVKMRYLFKVNFKFM